MPGTLRVKRPGRASASPEHDADRSARETLISQVLEAPQFQGGYFCVSQLSAPCALQSPAGRHARLQAVLEASAR
jgi:hypothetical protein